jgi:flagellar biosynthesis/type III secretory pathway protein FliH
MGRILKSAGAGREPPVEELLGRERAAARADVAAARAEAARLRAEAAEAGREEGLRALEGRRAEVEAEAARLRAEAVEGAEEEIVRLALEVAGSVLALAVQDERAALESARRALARARGRKELAARVHPADAAALRAAAPALLASAPRAGRLEIQEDPAVGRGGVLLETEAGSVDARIEAQLGELGRALRGEG